MSETIELSNVEIESVSQGILLLTNNYVEGERFDVTLTPAESKPEPEPFAPPWDDAPDWANWAAQDEDGRWYGYQNRPFAPGNELWVPRGGRFECILESHTPNPNWKPRVTRAYPLRYPVGRCTILGGMVGAGFKW